MLVQVFQAAKTADALRTFNDGGRFGRWMGNIEASIIGPHFYGDMNREPRTIDVHTQS